MPDLAAVIRRHGRELASLPGVVGVAEGWERGRRCLKVFVDADEADRPRGIPSEVEGYPVVVERRGELRALGDPEPRPPGNP